MNQKLPVLFFVCVLALAGSAQALNTDDLIAISAMPLAVADVAALPEVPQDDLISVIATLNHAAVPAPQFIEVVRYVPVALVDTSQPRFVTFVNDEYDRGIVGEPLAVAIADRYQTYGVREINVVDPPVMTIVEQREILPQVVVTRFEPVRFDPVSLVAMPLAVAAVSQLTDIPQNDLFQFVSALNQANVAPAQFVEVVRYSPVVLVDRTEAPQFVHFVTTEVDRGVTGRTLAYAVADRLRASGVETIDLTRSRPAMTVVDVEPVIVNRMHPHGGPPGQLKKQLGYQTGAEVVHGTKPGHAARVRVRDHDRIVVERPAKPRKVHVEKHRSAAPRNVVVTPQQLPRVMEPQRMKPAKQHGGGNVSHGGGQGNAGKGHGNAGGKGKGKKG